MKKLILGVSISVLILLLFFVWKPVGLEGYQPEFALSFERGANGSKPSDKDQAPLKPRASPHSDQVSFEFLSWIDKESDLIESPTADPSAKEEELRERAKALLPEEIIHLTMQVVSPETSARKKIFSVFLLSLDPQKTHMGLNAILKAPMNYAEQQQTHSPEETLATQEKTLRRMALEALLTRAKSDPTFRETFWLNAKEISDPKLRDYALEALANMN